MSNVNRKFYTTKEASEILGYNQDYVRQLARKGTLKSIQRAKNSRINFSKEYIDNYFENEKDDENKSNEIKEG